jgi:phage I-like protein
MTATASATCDRALSGDAPDWVHLFPAGHMTGRDGREFDLADPQAVIADFQSRAVDLPVDYEHQNDRKSDLRTGPVPVAGWIRELKADAAGLWGRVEWTAQARELIACRQYKYLSPSFYYAKAGNAITRLKGAGLVHEPNLSLKALASEEDTMTDATGLLTRLATLLDLPEGAAEQEVLTTLDEMTRLVRDMSRNATAQAAELRELRNSTTAPDPARYVPLEAVAELLSERNAKTATLGERVAAAKVDDAMRRGYLTPAMRPCRTSQAA